MQHIQVEAHIMKRRASEPKDLPISVVLGEWYEERKLEVAAMGRVALEKALVAAGVMREDEKEMGWEMLWLRQRLMYAGVTAFYAERGLEVPEATRGHIAVMDAKRGKMPKWAVDYFRDARAADKDERESKRLRKIWEEK